MRLAEIIADTVHAVDPEIPDVFAVFTEPLAAALRVLEAAPVSPSAMKRRTRYLPPRISPALVFCFGSVIW